MEIKTWKLWIHFIGYFLCFIVAGLIAAIPRIIYGFENESGLIVLISELLRIPITIILLVLYTKYAAKLSLNKQCLSFTFFKPLKWGVVGILLPLIVISIFYVSGSLTLLNTNFQIDQQIIIDQILRTFGMSIAAGITEELVFRSYMVNLLNKKYSFWIAAIIPSLLFTIIHIGAADSLFNVLQLVLAGLLVSIMFLVIYKKTGSIWNASIVHFFWNLIFLDEIIAYGISNETLNKVLVLDLGSNTFINGGNFGIQASLPAIIVYSLTIIVTWKFTKDKDSKTL